MDHRRAFDTIHRRPGIVASLTVLRVGEIVCVSGRSTQQGGLAVFEAQRSAGGERTKTKHR